MANKIITLGLVGPIASGKGLVADFLIHQYGFAYFKLSDVLRHMLEESGLSVTRANLQLLGNELRRSYGPAVLAKETVQHIIPLHQPVVIDGVRNPAEIDYLSRVLMATMIGIDAPVEQRLEWYLTRAKERGEDTATPAAFCLANAKDMGIGEPDTGQQVARCLQLCDFVLENSGSKKDLLNSLEHIIRDELHFSIEGQLPNHERV